MAYSGTRPSREGFGGYDKLPSIEEGFRAFPGSPSGAVHGKYVGSSPFIALRATFFPQAKGYGSIDPGLDFGCCCLFALS